MVDVLPTVIGDGGRGIEAAPVLLVDSLGSPYSASGAGGAKDEANSTTTTLGAGASFIGPWVTNNNEHIAFKAIADQTGEVFLETSLNGGSTIDLSLRYVVRDGDPAFDAIVKMPGRSHRVRYVNGAVAQTRFELQTATGNSLYPYKKSDRDEPAFMAYDSGAVSATTYALFVDLSDNVNFPHADTGRIDLYSSFLYVDRSSTATGAVRIGVITRIDGLNADISYVQGVGFKNASDRIIERDRQFVVPLKLGQSGGELTRVATSFKSVNVAAVNTATALPTSKGTAFPALGDVVIQMECTAGSYEAAISGQYAGNVSST